jgi:hypothetical protein
MRQRTIDRIAVVHVRYKTIVHVVAIVGLYGDLV